MLAALQNHLCNIYKVEPGHDVRDFLVTDPSLAKMLAWESPIPNTDEAVLLAPGAARMALSRYLDTQ